MTQIEIDALESIRRNLPGLDSIRHSLAEIAKQAKIKNEISVLKLKIANGISISSNEIYAIANELEDQA